MLLISLFSVIDLVIYFLKYFEVLMIIRTRIWSDLQRVFDMLKELKNIIEWMTEWMNKVPSACSAMLLKPWRVSLRMLWQMNPNPNHHLWSGDSTSYWFMIQLLDSSMFFFFKFLLYLFIFWFCWVFVAARVLSPVAASGGYSSLRCAGFSLQWLLLLRSMGSRHVGFSSCGMRALERRLSSCGTQA